MSQILLSAGLGLAHNMLAGVSSAGTREIEYRANEQIQNILAPPSALIHAYLMGRMSPQNFWDTMRMQGIDPRGFVARPEGPRLFDLLGPPPIGAVIQGPNRLFVNSWAAVMESMRPFPGTDQLMAMYARGMLSPSDWDRHMLRAGSLPEHWGQFLEAYQTYPSAPALDAMLNRQLISPAAWRLGMRRNGYTREEWLAPMTRLRYQLPNPSDIVRFMIKDVFAPDIVQTFGLDEEFEDQTQGVEIAKRLGIEWPLAEEIPGIDPNLTYMRMLYRASWRELAPTQAYEMLHRLRDDPATLARYGIPGLRPFTPVQARLVLRQADYPKPVRDWLIAISHRPLRLIDVRDAYYLNIKDEPWLKERLLDFGYSPGDAADLTDIYRRRKADLDFQGVRGMARTAVASGLKQSLRLYRAGGLDRAGLQGILVRYGISLPQAQVILDGELAREQADMLEKGVRAIRRAYLHAVFDRGQAEGRLRQIGLREERVQSLLDGWALSLDEGRRVLSGQQILRLAGKGLIDADEAGMRLRRLGWSDTETQLLLVEATLQLRRRQTQLIQAQERARRAQARQLEQVVIGAQRQVDQAQGRLRRISPAAKLEKWYVAGFIGPRFFRRRMAAMGFPPAETELYLAEAEKKRRAELSPEGQAREAEPSAPAAGPAGP